MLGARSDPGRVAGGAETLSLVANFDPSRGVRAECREGVGVEFTTKGSVSAPPSPSLSPGSYEPLAHCYTLSPVGKPRLGEIFYETRKLKV